MDVVELVRETCRVPRCARYTRIEKQQIWKLFKRLTLVYASSDGVHRVTRKREYRVVRRMPSRPPRSLRSGTNPWGDPGSRTRSDVVNAPRVR